MIVGIVFIFKIGVQGAQLRSLPLLSSFRNLVGSCATWVVLHKHNRYRLPLYVSNHTVVWRSCWNRAGNYFTQNPICFFKYTIEYQISHQGLKERKGAWSAVKFHKKSQRGPLLRPINTASSVLVSINDFLS